MEQGGCEGESLAPGNRSPNSGGLCLPGCSGLATWRNQVASDPTSTPQDRWAEGLEDKNEKAKLGWKKGIGWRKGRFGKGGGGGMKQSAQK